MSLPRGTFCWAPSPVISLIPWTAHSEVLGPLISTSEMTASRLQPPGLAPTCFLAAHPQEPHPWVLKQRSQGWAGWGSQQTRPELPPAPPRVLSWWLSGYFTMFRGKECLAPTFPSRCHVFLMTRLLPRQYCSPHDERLAPCVHGRGGLCGVRQSPEFKSCHHHSCP